MSAKLMLLACTRTRSAPVARLRVGRFAQLQSVWATATADEDLLHGTPVGSDVAGLGQVENNINLSFRRAGTDKAHDVLNDRRQRKRRELKLHSARLDL